MERDVEQRRRRRRDDGHPHPEAHDDEGRKHRRGVARGVGDPGEEEEPTGCHEEADGSERPRSEPWEQLATCASAHDGAKREGEEVEAGLDGAETVNSLEVVGHEEEHAKKPSKEEELRQERPTAYPVEDHAERQEWLLRLRLIEDEGNQQEDARNKESERPG